MSAHCDREVGMRAGRVWRWVAGFGAALLVGCGEKAEPAAAEHPGDVIIAQINERLLSAPEEERAWPVYLEAAELWLPDGEERLWELLSGQSSSHPATHHPSNRLYQRQWPGQREALDALLSDYRGVVDLVIRAAEMPSMGRAIYVAGDPELSAILSGSWSAPSGDLPRLLQSTKLEDKLFVRQMAWLLSGDALHAASEGDLRASVRSIEAIVSVADQIGESPEMFDQFFSMSIRQIAADTVLILVLDTGTPLDSDALDSLERLLDERLPDEAFHSTGWQKRGLLKEMLELCFHPGTRGRVNEIGLEVMRGHSTAVMRAVEDGGRLRASRFANREEFLAFISPILDVHDRRFVQRAWEREPDPYLVWISGPDFEWGRVTRDALAEPLIHSGIVLSEADLAMQLREAARLAIALRRHKLEHGEWPEDLQGLAFGELGVPLDVATGSPLAYRLTEDGPEIEAYWSRMPERPGRRDDWIVWPPEGDR